MPPTTPDPIIADNIDKLIATMAGSLDSAEVTNLKAYWTETSGVPREFDGKLLARARNEIGRDLAFHEKRYARAKFKAVVQAI
jgi:hypothetical protein